MTTDLNINKNNNIPNFVNFIRNTINMSTDLYASFSEQYANINTKLKKRFMRKPNISEATNEFIALAIQCEHSEQPAFAGQCYVGAAKCESSAGNFLGEAEQYLAAARQFMLAEKRLHSLKFTSPERENLEASIGCYMQALTKYPDKSPICTSVMMELAECLLSLNHKHEAVSYYEQALQNVKDKTIRLMCMRKLLNLQISCDKFDVALEIANNIVDSNYNLTEDILSELQITRIFLTLIVKPGENAKPTSLKKLFVDLLKDSETYDLPFNPSLLLNLQSIVICCETSDVPALVNVSSETMQYLLTQQKYLLHHVIAGQTKESMTSF